jgi:hypothetical protein
MTLSAAMRKFSRLFKWRGLMNVHENHYRPGLSTLRGNVPIYKPGNVPKVVEV